VVRLVIADAAYMKLSNPRCRVMDSTKGSRSLPSFAAAISEVRNGGTYWFGRMLTLAGTRRSSMANTLI
jgi:hypothetical protein